MFTIATLHDSVSSSANLDHALRLKKPSVERFKPPALSDRALSNCCRYSRTRAQATQAIDAYVPLGLRLSQVFIVE